MLRLAFCPLGVVTERVANPGVVLAGSMVTVWLFCPAIILAAPSTDHATGGGARNPRYGYLRSALHIAEGVFPMETCSGAMS